MTELREAIDKSWDSSRDMLKSIPNLLLFIDSCNFTCDQLHELFLRIEDLKGSDYYDDILGFDDSDRSDELREYNEWQ